MKILHFRGKNMPNRLRRHKNKIQYTEWSTDQDCLLIEHFKTPMDVLLQMLPYSEQEILARKEMLGLLTRAKQLRKVI